MSYLKTYIHFVWSTKNRRPYLSSEETRKMMWMHINENAAIKNIYVDRVGGYSDHCHCLVSLGIDQTMKKIMQLVKGESSHWFNRQDYIKEKFAWQDQFYAVSVSPEKMGTVRNYIDRQEQHHDSTSSRRELGNYLKKYGFQEYDG